MTSNTPEGTAHEYFDLHDAADEVARLFADDADPIEDNGSEEAAAEDADPEEDNGEDEDISSDADEDEEAEDDAEPEQASNDDHELTLPTGETVKVNTEELRKGYLRQADYTRKAQAIAAKDSAVGEKLNQLTSILSQYEVSQDQLDQLFDEDRDAYHRVKRQQEKLAVARQHQAQWAAQQWEARKSEEISKVREMIPEWRDQKTMEKEATELGSFMQKHGFEQELISQTIDARVIKLLRMAKAYEDLKAKPLPQPKPEKSKAPVKTGKHKTAKTAPRRYSEEDAWGALMKMDF